MTKAASSTKKKETCRIISHEKLATGIFDLRVESTLAGQAVPGQFAGLYVPDSANLLPRPISICDADEKKMSLRFVYRMTAEEAGTGKISRLKAGDTIEVLGLLGNGYDVSTAQGKRAVLMGGGIGVPPMLYLAKSLAASQVTSKAVTLVMGYRNAETFLADEFRQYGDLHIATDDGSVGTHGTVIDVLKSSGASESHDSTSGDSAVNDSIYFACGPKPMLKALKEYVYGMSADETGDTVNRPKMYISLEERMACGVGVCLGCITKTVHKDVHSGVHNARICTDGPVFEASDVEL